MALPEPPKNETSPSGAALPKNETTPPETAAHNSEVQPKEAAPQKAKKRSRKRVIILAIIILLVSLALYFLFKAFLSPKPGGYGEMVDVNAPVKTPETGGESGLAAEDSVNLPLAEALKTGQAIASSENFDLLQINLEGSGTNVFDLAENEILELSRIKSELYIAKENDKSEIRAIISCRTNKRSYIEVAYSKSGEKDKKIIKDTDLGFSHVLAIPALDPDSVYKYSVNATDLNQAQVSSEQFVFYTGAGNISLVDILGSAAQKVFGWAIGN